MADIRSAPTLMCSIAASHIQLANCLMHCTRGTQVMSPADAAASPTLASALAGLAAAVFERGTQPPKTAASQAKEPIVDATEEDLLEQEMQDDEHDDDDDALNDLALTPASLALILPLCAAVLQVRL